MKIYNAELKKVESNQYGTYATYTCEVKVKLKVDKDGTMQDAPDTPEFLATDTFTTLEGKQREYWRLPYLK